ncbi:RNA polymerase sigma factor [Niastella yeongjuensis]|nr:sigma-70 family RNA polymerase sigma factor [Niastella yeongjuensis]SEO59214.1 RNA polymerase sigma-70 factor, ECF subfamily [Niastella yeongjuensis]
MQTELLTSSISISRRFNNYSNTRPVPADEPLLLQRTADGDREAFSKLYSHYVPLLYKLLYPLTNENRQDTDEIIQDIFLQIWEKREVLIAIQSFQAYVFRMGRNMLVSRHRREKVKQRYIREIEYRQQDQSVQPLDHDILRIEYRTMVMEAINCLPPRQKEVFNLRTSADLSLKEIACLLKISLPAVKKNLYTAIRSIRKHLHEQGGWLLAFICCLIKIL